MAQRLLKSSPQPLSVVATPGTGVPASCLRFMRTRRPRLLPAGQIPTAFIALLLLLFFPGPARAAEHPYDVFARTIAPFTKVLSSDPSNRGSSLSLACTVVQVRGARDGTAPSPGSPGSPLHGASPLTIELFLQNPDKLLVRVPLQIGTVTLCRDGQQLWAAPGELVRRLAQQSGIDLNAPGQLPSLQLPFNGKQLVLLPAFFKVTDAGTDQGLRLLDVALMPELARNLAPFSARLHIGQTLARIDLKTAAATYSCRIERLEFSKALPASTWQAPAEAAPISPGAVNALLTDAGL